MKYRNPEIESSYRKANLGRTLYDFVLEKKPTKILEFGTLHGYSTICMAMALKELGRGKIISYDLYKNYDYVHGDIETNKKTAMQYGLNHFIEFREGDIWDCEEDADLIHLDISNTGDIVKRAREKFKGTLIFEGGSDKRDRVDWMRKYKKTPMRNSIEYRILDSRFPSISLAL